MPASNQATQTTESNAQSPKSKLFDALKDGLRHDCKDNLNADTVEQQSANSDVDQRQAAIGAWAVSVMKPFTKKLNRYNHSGSKLVLVSDGESLNFAGDGVDDFVSASNFNDYDKIRDLFEDWQHSTALIGNMSELSSALHSRTGNLVRNLAKA